MLRDQAKVDALRREVVQRAVIGFAVHAPEAAAADVGQAGTELVAEQMGDAEDRVGVRAGVGHDLGRLQLGLLLQDNGEQHRAIAQRAPYGDAVQAGSIEALAVAAARKRRRPRFIHYASRLLSPAARRCELRQCGARATRLRQHTNQAQ